MFADGVEHVQIRAGGLREKGSRLNRQNLCDLRAGSVVVLRAVSEEPGFRGGGGDVFEILGVEEGLPVPCCGWEPSAELDPHGMWTVNAREAVAAYEEARKAERGGDAA